MTMWEGSAHGYCLLWDGRLITTHVLADGLIALAYFLIPVVLFQCRKLFAWEAPRTILGLFGLFIIGCGLTHVMDIVVLWYPLYWLQAVVKMLTAAASLLTFRQLLLLLRLIPPGRMVHFGVSRWYKF